MLAATLSDTFSFFTFATIQICRSQVVQKRNWNKGIYYQRLLIGVKKPNWDIFMQTHKVTSNGLSNLVYFCCNRSFQYLLCSSHLLRNQLIRKQSVSLKLRQNFLEHDEKSSQISACEFHNFGRKSDIAVIQISCLGGRRINGVLLPSFQIMHGRAVNGYR